MNGEPGGADQLSIGDGSVKKEKKREIASLSLPFSSLFLAFFFGT